MSREMDERPRPRVRANRLLDGPVPGLVGRLQRRAWRGFLLADGAPLTTGELARCCHPRHSGYASWRYRLVRRAASRWADRVGRVEGRQGRPILWQLKPEVLEAIRGGKAERPSAIDDSQSPDIKG